MNNMLYIIAGLAIILLIAAVLVTRKNKAQQPSTQLLTPDNKRSVAKATVLDQNTNRPNSNQNAITASANKFDHVTIAERFIDQQRYDKAIEALQRGLIEKPNDDPLMLKLLNVYVITGQRNDFYKLYDTIKVHCSQPTINQAQQLRAMIDKENNTLLSTSESSVASVGDINTSTDGLTLDFEKSTPNQADTNIVTTNNEDAFELSLDDLTVDNVEPNHSESDILDLTSVPTSNLEISKLSTDSSTNNFDDLKLEPNELKHTTEPLSLDTPVNPHKQSPTTDNLNTDNIENDFKLDFDLPSDDIATDRTADSGVNEVGLNNDDFFLDFDDLTAGSTNPNNLSLHNPAVSEQQSIDDNGFEDFTLSLDGEDISATSVPTLKRNEQENGVSSEVADILSQLNTSSLNKAEQLVTTNVDVTAPIFDDNSFIDDDFDFDFDNPATTPTATMPVEGKSIDSGFQHDDIISTDDFAAQFAADFDFVKTLDNNQVTLDLASQYIQLGEYDSAKRLLNEVISQGNSEQQSQAQTLLARSA